MEQGGRGEFRNAKEHKTRLARREEAAHTDHLLPVSATSVVRAYTREILSHTHEYYADLSLSGSAAEEAYLSSLKGGGTSRM